MENREHSPCQGFVEFMTDEMSEVERKRFERHMETCAACREDAAEWLLVWERLAGDAPLQPLPSDLKAEVMQAVFAAEEVPVNVHTMPNKGKPFRKPLKWLAMTAALAIAFWAGFGWRNMLPPTVPSALPAEASPSQIEKLFRLQIAADKSVYNNDGKFAYGVACVLRSEGERRLVVYTFGAPTTQGESVYQVWLLKDGQRSSAGTFTVDSSGIGLLTIPWPEKSPAFDKVGVTLEPDSRSTSPRGQKMFQSV